ncbi:cilia- and flagella-associated protein 57-like [Schistocerca gregaria]|uniref:cilia- and flagella-associated protein 57-like n=1 Tax=Schistocerca gregaria TaxID=7010 RepID=UPI00211EF2C1|nr:cilia- and flagella-associated protein 57-like [Schistocerca gregaria]
MVCLVGPGVLQLLTVSGAAWHQLPAARVELLPISCGCWLTGEQLLCGTRDGRLVLLHNGQLRATFRAADLLSFDADASPPPQPTEQLLSTSTSTLEMRDPKGFDDMTVREMLCFQKGVAYSCGLGKVHFFEREEGSLYQKRNVFTVPKPEFAGDVFDMNCIQTLSVNAAGDHLMAVTNCCQLYHVRLWGPHMNEEPEIPFSILGERLHHGPISGLSTCLWKPIFVTSGREDHTLRVWNYETERQMFIRQYKQQLYCAAAHPTGLFIAVGFENRLCYMTVLLSDVLPLQYFPIKACSECVFSAHGQVFAAADGTIVRIYSAITFKNVLNLEYHKSKVCSIRWACMDNMLVSCSPDGTIVIWDIPRGEITGQIALGPGLSQIAVTSDGKTIITVSKDGLLREITNNSFSMELDKDLQAHLIQGSVFNGISKTIQNGLLQCTLEVYHDEVCKEIKYADYVAIVMAESTGVSCEYQLVIVLHYFVKGKPVERFWNFVNRESQNAHTVAQSILKQMEQLISYDRA